MYEWFIIRVDLPEWVTETEEDVVSEKVRESVGFVGERDKPTKG